MRRAVPVTALLVVLATSGCLGELRTYYTSFDPDIQYVNPGVFEGDYEHVDANGSAVLEPGWLEAGTPELVRLVSERPADVATGSESEDAVVYITLAVWRPTNASQPMPVLVDAGPFFEIGKTIDVPGGTLPFLLSNYLPQGYAVAAVATRGTGTSGGCMEFMGPRERDDLSQAITWLAQQPWSNGNVGMIGAHYDAASAWMVAATGNPHLKTIVPISGFADAHDWLFHNGSAKRFASATHRGPFWSLGFDDDFPYENASIGSAYAREDYQDLQNLQCPDAAEGAALGLHAWGEGGRGGAASDYWAQRDHRDAVLQNYKGSVFLVHGLQDMDVEPHNMVPFNTRLREAGIPLKEWYGQWWGSVPDGSCPQQLPRWRWSTCRLDFAEVLDRWLERHLRGNETLATGPPVQVQDNRGVWRNADAFPPSSPTWRDLHATAGHGLVPEAAEPRSSFVLYPPQPEPGPGPLMAPETWSQNHTGLNHLDLVSEPVPADVHVSGLPRLDVAVEAMGPGGFLTALLFDEAPDGRVLSGPPLLTMRVDGSFERPPPAVARAQMDLRFHAGGDTADPLAPGERTSARMGFEPVDLWIPEGHRLRLRLFQVAQPGYAPSAAPSPVRVVLGGDDGTVLRLPTIEVSPYDTFPVPGSHFPDRRFFERYDVELPPWEDRVDQPPDQATAAPPHLALVDGGVRP